jgi:Flp pilus assembly pilin Flp
VLRQKITSRRIWSNGKNYSADQVSNFYSFGEFMSFLNRMFIRAREWRRGQTMTEYALILSAVAVVVFVTYQVMGQDVNSLVNKVDKTLTAT